MTTNSLSKPATSETVVVAYSEIQSLDHTEFETRLARRLPWVAEIESHMVKLNKGGITNVGIAFGPTGLLGDTHKIAGVYFCKDVAVALTAIRSIPGFENAVTENDRGAIPEFCRSETGKSIDQLCRGVGAII